MIRAVIFEERDGDFSAILIQCLERDICVQGSTIQESVSRMAGLITFESSMRDGCLDSIAPAPQSFFAWFDTIVSSGAVAAKALGITYFNEPDGKVKP